MKKWLLYFISIALAYGLSLKFGFFQDDFFHLLISRADSLSDFLQFFIPDSSSWIFFRPLSTELYYYTFTSIFGLTIAPILMHLFMLMLHATNAYLVQGIARRVKGISNSSSTVIGFLYGIWGVHFMSLFYIGATQELLTMFFSLLSLNFLLRKKYLPHLLMLLMALLSKELSIRIPVFIFFYLLLVGRSLRDSLKLIVPSIVLVSIYLVLRFALGITTPSEYVMVFSPFTTFATTMWYSLMSLGMPEHILSFGLSGGMVDLASFLRASGFIGYINLGSFIGLLAFIIRAIIRLGRSQPLSILALAGIWLSSILPVIFLPTHRYAHYLDLSSFALLTLIFLSVTKRCRPIIIILGILASLSSIYIDYSTHWTVARARIATAITERVHSDQACDYSTWYITGSEYVIQEVEYAVLWDNFLPIICSTPVNLVYNEPSGIEYYQLDLSESDLEIQ